MLSKEKCPRCGSGDYELFDYGNFFDNFEVREWWTCVCCDCECQYDITKIYKLSNMIVKEVSAS